jgi:pimeloyl-ACP methyl ester carboxylesterase
VFTGLFVALWSYKCLMTVLFQDKIIYMPYMPPFARSEKLEDYIASCMPVTWEQRHIKSSDGIRITLAIGQISRNDHKAQRANRVVICYFHGNGGSVPHRTPLLSNTLKLIHARASESASPSSSTDFTIVALSYRGYWTSSGRASERGIRLDAQALMSYVTAAYPGAEIILWGQSLGASIASTAAAEHLQHAPDTRGSSIIGLILETPFTSIKSMLLALYPQKWLPYQYLHPFLWNRWDSEVALRQIALAECRPRVLLLPATRDEVVPPTEIDKLARVCEEVGLETQRVNVLGALHTEATTRREGQEAVARFVLDVVHRQ